MQGAFFPETNEDFKVEDKKIAQSTVRFAKISHSTFSFFLFFFGFAKSVRKMTNRKLESFSFFFRGHSIQFNFIQFLMPFIRSENYSWRWPRAGEHRSIIQTISRFLGSSERLQVRVWTIKCWTPFTMKLTISVHKAKETFRIERNLETISMKCTVLCSTDRAIKVQLEMIVGELLVWVPLKPGFVRVTWQQPKLLHSKLFIIFSICFLSLKLWKYICMSKVSFPLYSILKYWKISKL